MVSDDVGIAVVSLFYCFLYDNVADYGAALSLEGPSTLLPSVAADALVDLEQWPDPRCALPPPSLLPACLPQMALPCCCLVLLPPTTCSWQPVIKTP